MNSRDMNALNVFNQETSLLAKVIEDLEAKKYDDPTEERLGDDQIWALQEVQKYFKARISEIQG